MRVRDIETVLADYDKEADFVRRYITGPLPVIRHLMKISESFANKDSLISEAHIRNMLALHWVEIKDSNIQYFAKESQLRATEKAVIALAKKLDPQQQNEQERSSYIAISVLMPGHFSFSRRVNLEASVSIIDGCVFDYLTFAEELIIDGDEAASALTPFNKYLAKFTLAQVKQLIKIFANTPEDLTVRQTQEFNKIKATLIALQKDFEFVGLVKSCRNIHDGFSTPLKKLSSSYFFKTEDNIGFDLRSLFFTGFLNPSTTAPLSQTDLARAQKHPHLGLLLKYYTQNNVQDFFKSKCEIEVEEKYEIEIDVPIAFPQALAEEKNSPYKSFTDKIKRLVHHNVTEEVNSATSRRTYKQKVTHTRKVTASFPFDFYSKSELIGLTDAPLINIASPGNNLTSDLKLEQRQIIYFQLQNLRELSSYFHQNNFINTVPASCPLKEKIVKFERIISEVKNDVIWTEMTNYEFFKRAAVVVNDMEKIMGSEWSPSTRNFFLAMTEFALFPDIVLSRAANTSYIRSNNEYLVRVPGLDTFEGAKKALKNLVDQFRGSFEIAYRYNRLQSLMSGMTPAGICIAEKMKHLCSMLAQVSSIASEVGDIHSVFARMMAAATKAEAGPPAALWGGSSFQQYLVTNYVGTKYLAEDGKTELAMTRIVINNYLMDILMYDDITREGPAQPAP